MRHSSLPSSPRVMAHLKRYVIMPSSYVASSHSEDCLGSLTFFLSSSALGLVFNHTPLPRQSLDWQMSSASNRQVPIASPVGCGRQSAGGRSGQAGEKEQGPTIRHWMRGSPWTVSMRWLDGTVRIRLTPHMNSQRVPGLAWIPPAFGACAPRPASFRRTPVSAQFSSLLQAAARPVGTRVP